MHPRSPGWLASLTDGPEEPTNLITFCPASLTAQSGASSYSSLTMWIVDGAFRANKSSDQVVQNFNVQFLLRFAAEQRLSQLHDLFTIRVPV